ncbi:MAG: sulfotransferase family protein [Jiangellaceae bacterium]
MSGADRDPFVFVVGCGRSGTTVLRTVLDSHPDLAVSHEGRFIYPLSRRRERYERPEGFDVAAFTADLLADRAVRTNLGLGEDDLRTALGGPPVVDYPDAVRRIFTHYAARAGKRRYGDKMPAYVLHLPVLGEMFPEARFVHIIRDGRDVALSSLAIDDNRLDALDLALNWKIRVGTGRADGRALGPHRYHEVRYEALITEPTAHVTGLCEFLDLDFDPAMLRFAEKRTGVPEKVLVNPRHARLAEPLSPGLRSWRTHMGRRDLEVFEAAAGHLLTELGYERAVARPPLSARVRVARGRVRHQVDRGRARLPGLLRRARQARP